MTALQLADTQDVAILLGGSNTRLGLLRFAMKNERITALEAMEATGLSRNGIGKHLDELTDAGFLIEERATHPRGIGGVIYWRADRDRIARVFWTLAGEFLFEGAR